MMAQPIWVRHWDPGGEGRAAWVTRGHFSAGCWLLILPGIASCWSLGQGGDPMLPCQPCRQLAC